MQTSLSDTIFEFAVDLASSARLFTLQQVARHPKLAKRTQPVKRASEILRRYEESFEKFPGPFGEPFRFRLTAKERRKRGIKQYTVDPNTQRARHWLAMGDLWTALTLYVPFAGTPEKPLLWITEPKDSGGFDVFCVWRGKAYLFEIQRTRLTEKEWIKKWEARKKWYFGDGWTKAPWQPKPKLVKPQIVLVAGPQTEGVMNIPTWVTWIRDIEDVPRRLLIRSSS